MPGIYKWVNRIDAGLPCCAFSLCSHPFASSLFLSSAVIFRKRSVSGGFNIRFELRAWGSVSGNEDVSVLVGSNWDFVEFSFWDIEPSGQEYSRGGTGKSTAKMQMQSTFTDAGWDFVDESVNGTEDIWWILEGQDYPRLWWEKVEE